MDEVQKNICFQVGDQNIDSAWYCLEWKAEK